MTQLTLHSGKVLCPRCKQGSWLWKSLRVRRHGHRFHKTYREQALHLRGFSAFPSRHSEGDKQFRSSAWADRERLISEPLESGASGVLTVDANIESSDNRPRSFLQQKAQAVLAQRNATAQASSITHKEKALFDEIWRPRGAFLTSGRQSQSILADQSDTGYMTILQLFPSTSKANTDGGSHEAVDPSLVDHDLCQASNQDRVINETALKILQDISSSLENALASTDVPPDHAMWMVCEEKAFPLVKLITPTTNSLNNESSTTTTSGPTPQFPPLLTTQSSSSTDHPLIPNGIPLIPLLSATYPAALLVALRLFQRHHPTSQYCLDFLPHIKSLGPTSYVLGANTHFYNTLIAIQWDVYSNLDEVGNLLAEMDRTGLEFDLGTAAILREIADTRAADLRTHHPVSGAVGSAQNRLDFDESERGRHFWARQLIDRDWDRVREWKGLIARRLEEKGLGLVMREGEEEDVEGHRTLAGISEMRPL